MKSKAYTLVILISIMIFTSSCTKITCEGFDLNHEVMEWHFFPELLEEYTFSDIDSNKITLSQTYYRKSEFKEW